MVIQPFTALLKAGKSFRESMPLHPKQLLQSAHIRFKKDFGGRMAATITSEEVEDWLDNLKDERTGENLSRISRAYARRDIRARREAEVCDQKSIQGNQQANRRP